MTKLKFITMLSNQFLMLERKLVALHEVHAVVTDLDTVNFVEAGHAAISCQMQAVQDSILLLVEDDSALRQEALALAIAIHEELELTLTQQFGKFSDEQLDAAAIEVIKGTVI